MVHPLRAFSEAEAKRAEAEAKRAEATEAEVARLGVSSTIETEAEPTLRRA